MDQVTAVLASLGVVQALFLSLYLLILQKGNRTANTFLALVLIGLSIRIGKSVFNYFLVLDPWQRNLGLSGLLIVGPSIWLYGRVLIERTWKPSHAEMVHYLPAALFIIFSWLIPNQFSNAAYVVYCLVMLHWLIYLIVAERQRRLRMFSLLSDDLNRWYRNIVIGLTLILIYYAAVFLRIVPYYIGGAVIYSALIYLFSYMMLQKHHFTLEKYGGSKISKKETQQLLQNVMRLMDERERYLDSRLSIGTLASELDVSSRELSRAINENRQQNFSEFVNEYRVRRATKLLENTLYQDTKLAVIAIECGFGNTTSFNLAFKSIMQTTPSDYRRSCRTIKDV